MEKIKASRSGLKNENAVLEIIKKEKTIEGLCQEMVIADYQIMIAKVEKDLEELKNKLEKGHK